MNIKKNLYQILTINNCKVLSSNNYFDVIKIKSKKIMVKNSNEKLIKDKETLQIQQIFNATPECYLVLTPEIPRFTIFAETDICLESTKTQRDEIIGNGMFEVYPNNLDETVTYEANATSSFKRVIETHRADLMDFQKSDIFVLNPKLKALKSDFGMQSITQYGDQMEKWHTSSKRLEM